MMLLRWVLCSIAVWVGVTSTALGADLPRNSLYQLEVVLTDQDGRSTLWSEAAHPPAGPRIVSMFYSRCDYVCPMLFEAIRQLEAQLPAAQRERLRVGLVTLDPARDDVSALKKTADQRGGDPARWRLYRTSNADVRKLAGVLGVQYRLLTNGEFNHSTLMILLDSRGVELARTNQIAKPDPRFLQAVIKATALPQ
ncbi:MAG: SCO family protein [Burkholderiaceae bacterium]